MPVTNYHTLNGELLGETGPGGRRFYGKDALGSVVATYDQNGTLENTYRYKPYGGLLSKTGSAPDPRFMWTGSTGSRTTGASYAEQYNRARHYGSRQAGWTSVDQQWPQQPQYGYCSASPCTFLDPLGLEEIELALNAFIPKRMGPWIWEPDPMSKFQYKGDYRTFNQPGTSRISTTMNIDTCLIGTKATLINWPGRSTRRELKGNSFVVDSLDSTSLVNERHTFGNKSVGGPCQTYFRTRVKSAYPWYPAWAPTQVAMKGWARVSGQGQVTVDLGISHSVFPDFELLVKQRGVSRLAYGYATPYPNWMLIAHLDVIKYFSIAIGDVDTDCCCTNMPCCPGECPC